MSGSLLGSKRLQPLRVDFRKRPPPCKSRLDLRFLGGRLREVCLYFAIYLFHFASRDECEPFEVPQQRQMSEAEKGGKGKLKG